MHSFELITAASIKDAVQAQAASSTAQQGAAVRFIAGGTNLVDYMKLNVETPRQLVDRPRGRVVPRHLRLTAQWEAEGRCCSPSLCGKTKASRILAKFGAGRLKPLLLGLDLGRPASA